MKPAITKSAFKNIGASDPHLKKFLRLHIRHFVVAVWLSLAVLNCSFAQQTQPHSTMNYYQFMLGKQYAGIRINAEAKPMLVTLTINFAKPNSEYEPPRIPYDKVVFRIFDTNGKQLECSPAAKEPLDFSIFGSRGFSSSGRYTVQTVASTLLGKAYIKWENNEATVDFTTERERPSAR